MEDNNMNEVTKTIVENYKDAEKQMSLVRDVVNQVEKMLDSKGIKYKEPVLTGSFVLHYEIPRFRWPKDIDVVFIIPLEQYDKFANLYEYVHWAFPEAKDCIYKTVFRDITLSFMLRWSVNVIFKVEQEPQDISTDLIFGFKHHTVDSILNYKQHYDRFKDEVDFKHIEMITEGKGEREISDVLWDMEFKYQEAHLTEEDFPEPDIEYDEPDWEAMQESYMEELHEVPLPEEENINIEQELEELSELLDSDK